MEQEQIFNDAYWLHQPPVVRGVDAVRGVVDSSKAVDLAAKGYVIDTAIMIWGWSPYKTMLLRQQYGYTWVPSALQPPVLIIPGIGVPGMMPYDPFNPPKGSIKVSLDPKDYPPFDPPAPIKPPAPDAKAVGVYMGVGNMYFASVGTNYKDGDLVTQDGATYKARVVATPFGSQRWFEKQS